jgi:DNA-binding NtrC family response regulator
VRSHVTGDPTAVKIRVLLVDDEEDFVDILAQRLEVRGFDVSTALNGADALRKIASEEIDLVILDLQMPGVDGIAVLQEIKELKPLIEVIMLTGHATVETAIEGMKRGAFDFLIKPTETEELMEKINGAFNRKADQDERIREAEIEGIMKRRGW